MKSIKLIKEDLWNVFEKEFLNSKKFTKKFLIDYLNIHLGTINRWIQTKNVPKNYFVELNHLLESKYEIDITKEEKYKLYDQFFTEKEEAKNLVKKSLEFIQNNFDINLNEYTLIEPSAGNGSFLENFPKGMKKIGLDIEPQNKNILKMNYFDFDPNNRRSIVIGNPPFGLRGQLALKFINKSAEFADFICFVLPPLFNSNGKGSPMLRINKDFYLAKEFPVTSNFFFPDGKKIKVNSIFQIWTKIFSKKIKPIKPEKKSSEWIKVYALSNGNTSSSKRNVKMIDKCDFYLPSTTFSDLTPSDSFSALPNNRGYGIVIKKDKKEILKLLKKIDWRKVSFKSTNGANNLRTQLIIDALEREIVLWKKN